jgi:hypothetical protein
MQQPVASPSFSQKVYKEIQTILNNPNLTPELKVETAFAQAQAVKHNEVIITISRQADGTMVRTHTYTEHNGIVRNPDDINLFNNLFAAAQNNNGIASVQATVKSHTGEPEVFTYDVMMVDLNHLVIVRH